MIYRYSYLTLRFTSSVRIPGLVDASEGGGRHFTVAVRFLSGQRAGRVSLKRFWA